MSGKKDDTALDPLYKTIGEPDPDIATINEVIRLAHDPKSDSYQEFVQNSENLDSDVRNLKFLNLKQRDSLRQQRRTEKIARDSKTKDKRKSYLLSSKIKKSTKIYEIPKDQQKYANFVPLLEMWNTYMGEVIGSGGMKGPEGEKLLKCDYHGAMMEVVRCRSPSRIGIRGICIKENRNTFELITENNQLKLIPKEMTVFKVTVDTVGLKYEIFGSQFLSRAADRAGRKFKMHPLADI